MRGGSVKDFALAVWSDWLTLPSGPPSVPVAAAAFWVSNKTAQTLLVITAFCCLLFSAYRLWKREHDKVIERDQRKRQLLDDISDLRKTIVQYRIAMEAEHRAQQFNQAAWHAKYDACKIRSLRRLSNCLRKPKQSLTVIGGISRVPTAQIAQTASYGRS